MMLHIQGEEDKKMVQNISTRDFVFRL